MAWFLACFGYSKKRKRRKPRSRFLSGEQVHGSYEPLDSDVIIKLDIREKPISSASESRREKPKETLSFGLRKKVSFNLNVKTYAYEPIPNDGIINYYSGSDEEKTKWKENEEETAEASILLSHSKGGSTESRMRWFPSSYRYQNCRDSYDEVNDIKLEESDLEDDHIDDHEEQDYYYDSKWDSTKTNQVEFSEKFNSSSVGLEKILPFAQLAEVKAKNIVPFCTSTDEVPKKLEINRNARGRSEYVYPVLNPVENLTQWKAVKARAPPPLKQQRKENIGLEQEQISSTLKPSFNRLPFSHKTNMNNSKPPKQDIAVDASFSNWLISSETETITTSNKTAIAARS